MRWGIVGIGQIVLDRFLPAIEKVEGAEVKVLVTTHPEKVKNLAQKYNAEVVTDINEIRDVDIVYIATPNKFHKEQAIICAKKGIHIFCEKPIALNVRETEEIIEECEKNGVVLGVANMGRFNPYNIGAKELLEKNIVGKIGIIKATYSFVNTKRDAWRYKKDLAGGGAIMDIGVHVINTLHFFRSKNKIVEITSINEFYEYEVEQNAGAVAKFDDGVIVLMDASYDTSLSVSFEIRGKEGILYVLDTLYQEYDGKVFVRKENNITFYNFYGENQYIGEIKDMEKAVKNKTKPATCGYEALKDMKVIDAWYRSYEEGKRIKIDY